MNLNVRRSLAADPITGEPLFSLALNASFTEDEWRGLVLFSGRWLDDEIELSQFGRLVADRAYSVRDVMNGISVSYFSHEGLIALEQDLTKAVSVLVGRAAAASAYDCAEVIELKAPAVFPLLPPPPPPPPPSF